MSLSLTAWLSKATPDQARKLAKFAKSSVKSIRHIAAGRRRGSADAAVKLGNASVKISTESLGAIDQGSVCPACKTCPHYKYSNLAS